jgi:hypothetical protein
MPLSRQIDMSILIIITNLMLVAIKKDVACEMRSFLHTNYPGNLSAAVSNQHRINSNAQITYQFKGKNHNMVPYINSTPCHSPAINLPLKLET